MNTKILLAAALLLATTFAALPSAQAAPPIYCVMAPCGPGGDPPLERVCDSTIRQPAPGVWLYSNDDCSQRIDIKSYDCVWNCGWHVLVQGPPLTVRYFGQNSPETSSEQPPCTCPPPQPICREQEIATSDFLAYMGPHAAVGIDGNCKPYVRHDPLLPPIQAAQAGEMACMSEQLEGTFFSVTLTNSCRVVVHQSDPVCHKLADFERRPIRPVSAGPAEVHASACVPELDCTCPPIQATSAASAQLPVEVEFVQCVTEPCPPIVRCTTSSSHVGVFQVDRSRNCHLTFTQDRLPCEGSTHEWTTVGLVTVGRSYCGPGIEP